ncbi:YeiH family protein [Saccharicrinis sp. FJH62]|uniref:YeiH family protein n=1 Tax=Saccharicrinis sp. FJH62 TaxID=3344657 RepID=UPI0035D47A3C
MTFFRKHAKTIYGVVLFVCLLPFMTPAIALLTGILFSVLGITHKNIHKYTSYALQASIVLLGFGMNLAQVLSASKTGFAETAISVTLVMSSGILLGWLLKVEPKTALLISAGTAICGGSAIAAVSPVINAKNNQISFALITVFVLNAIALFIFPVIGHYLNLSQEQFGNWAAIAIHDTSSVVGAGATYGSKALQVATTVKLIRALWIIPLSVVIALFNKGKTSGRIKFPWFILLFAVAVVVAYLFPEMKNTFAHFSWLGKRGMVIALFLIGSNISVAEIKKAGIKSFALGIMLWFIIGSTSLYLLTR